MSILGGEFNTRWRISLQYWEFHCQYWVVKLTVSMPAFPSNHYQSSHFHPPVTQENHSCRWGPVLLKNERHDGNKTGVFVESTRHTLWDILYRPTLPLRPPKLLCYHRSITLNAPCIPTFRKSRLLSPVIILLKEEYTCTVYNRHPVSSATKKPHDDKKCNHSPSL